MNFVERYGPWAVVAGASEGVGASLARQLGGRGVNVVQVARRHAALAEVAASVATETRLVAVDLSSPDGVAELTEATSDLEIGLFIYNAGADPNPSRFFNKPLEDHQAMVARNCASVVESAYHYAGRMVQRGHGGIVLVTSGAAWSGGANIAIYAASKAFDLVLAESLWAELKPDGGDVLALVLGPTDTPAFRRVLRGREMEGMADPDVVAADMLDNLAEGPTYPPGPSPFGAMSRRDAVSLMSQGTASLQEDTEQR
jgi:uncharacterized protein